MRPGEQQMKCWRISERFRGQDRCAIDYNVRLNSAVAIVIMTAAETIR